MAKSTAAGNVTAEEFTTPTVVRDALGRDHVVGPMGNMDDVEKQRRELDDAGKGEPKIDDNDTKTDEQQQTGDKGDKSTDAPTPLKPADTKPQSASQRSGLSGTK